MTRPFRYFVYGGVTVSIVWGLLFFYLVNLQLENTWKHFKLPGALEGRRHLKLQARDGAKVAAYPGEIVRRNRNSGGTALDDSPVKIAARLQERKNKQMDIVELGIVRSDDDNDLKNAGNRLYAFNQLISDRIGFFRDLPDFRAPGCANKVYPRDLPSASVVICFYNEAWSVLLRTVYSVIDFTPPELLHEIILVDDHSDLNHLKEELNMFVTIHFSKVKVFHSAERLGLIRARMYGAGKANGEVLVFLDSHCEVTKGWIQPLLARVQNDRRNVVLPIIDIISAETFKYEPSPLVRGGFNWGLHYRWDAVPKPRENQSLADPIQTPTMAGGLFAIERDYFFTMGQYDPGMEIWGGENLEMSFRIWQCGGRLEILPCSRVGHVFRHRRPYGDPKGHNSMSRNSLRVAHVWMDDYKEEFFKLNPDLRNAPYGDISDRLKLRKRLGCKSFQWYLDNVYPEQVLSGKGKSPIMVGDRFPRKKGKITKRGLLKHDQSGMCVEPVGTTYEKQSSLTLARCEEMSKRQTWYETDASEMKLAATLCLDIDGMGAEDKVPRLMKCHGEAGSQEWHWSIQAGTSRLYNPSTGKCLSVSTGNGRYAIVMGICDQSPARTFHFL